MSSIVNLKSQDPTRIDVAQAIRQYSANKNLGNAKFCNNITNIVDEFGRPGNHRNLVKTTGSPDCAMYTYPVNEFIANENSIRPAQITSFLNAQGSGDTLSKGAKRDFAPTNLYNPSLNNLVPKTENFTSLYGNKSNTQPIIYDPSTLRLKPQNATLVQLS